jgi:hypothetical protein
MRRTGVLEACVTIGALVSCGPTKRTPTTEPHASGSATPGTKDESTPDHGIPEDPTPDRATPDHSTATATPDHSTSTNRPSANAGCIPADEPTNVIVRISRHTLPIGKSATQQTGAVTRTGSCPPAIECATITPATMSKIWTALRGAATVEHGSPSSPHYGGRWLQVSWTGGACEIADSSETPVTGGADRFDRAFDAISDAIIAGRAPKP